MKNSHGKEVEESFRRKQDFTSTLLDNIADGVVACDANGILVSFNRVAREWHGIDALALPPDEWGNHYDLYGPDGITPLPTEKIPLVRAIRGETVSNAGMTIVAKGQPPRHILASGGPFFDAGHNLLGAVIVLHDITERKISEEALRKSEEKYRTIIENMGEGFGFLDIEEKFVVVNSSAEKIFGVNKGELTGLCLSNFLSEKNLETIKNETSKRSRGESSTYELEILLKDGSKKYILVTATPNFDDKKFIGTFGIFRDITQRKQAEEALKESEAIHRTLVERMPDGVYKSTHDGKFLDVNPAMVKMLGYESKEDLKSIDIKTQLYFEPIDRESLVLQEKMVEMGIYRLKKKDGSEIWVEDHGWYDLDENGNILFHEGIMRDISDRRKTEKLMSMLAHTTRSISECISITDMNDKIIYINRAFLKTYKYEEHELLGNSINMVRSPNNPPAVVQDILPATLRGGWQGELLNTSKDGSEFPIYISSSVIRDENGEPIALVGIATDITERKRSEDELKLKNEQLNNAIAEKDKFFSIIAHDLRSPFNSLLGLTQIMAEEMPAMGLEEIHEIVLRMRKSATNLYSLLENLLEWSLIQRGKTVFDPVSFLLLPKISESIEVLAESAHKKEIEITMNISDDLVVFADINMFGGIIRNLATNALKFTPKGGKVVINAKPIHDNSVEISISDTGIGMNRAMVDNLFRLDIQTTRNGTENEPSTGLGLIICKDLIEKHGGNLWAESAEGKGSTFFFTLPAKT